MAIFSSSIRQQVCATFCQHEILIDWDCSLSIYGCTYEPFFTAYSL
jgi:hypothetical protein